MSSPSSSEPLQLQQDEEIDEKTTAGLPWKGAPGDHLTHKLLLPSGLPLWLREQRQAIGTLVTVNGSFDLLHAGHLEILLRAAEQGDFLLVALNSDSSIRLYKGKERPIIALSYRLQMVAALECVQAVTWFDETTPCRLLELIRPEVHVNGIEYGPACIEADVVREGGGRLHLVDRVPGLATSAIIEKIVRSQTIMAALPRCDGQTSQITPRP